MIKVTRNYCLQLHKLTLMSVTCPKEVVFCGQPFGKKKLLFSAILGIFMLLPGLNRNITDILFPPILACLHRVYPWSMNACGRYIKVVNVMPSVSTHLVCGSHPPHSQQILYA
jgi:hypothetical protein